MKSFVNGRKSVFDELEEHIKSDDQIIWVHAASLGEYEQGVPVMERLKKEFPAYKILVSFFSPSGYEVKKNNHLSDLTVYLPLDTRKNADKFIALARPKLALFIKYEIWPNYLYFLNKKQIPAILVSGNFRMDQIYFKSYGAFLKKALKSFRHLFVQTKEAKEVLLSQGINQTSLSGDTRFDRVSQQLQMDNSLPEIESFIDGKLCFIGGSTWPEDEQLLLEFINNSTEAIKFVIAPHQIKADAIRDFQDKLQISNITYSQRTEKDLKNYRVLIVDNVGLLTRIYAYGDLAYVGGAAGKTGLHNILEPAAFGMPIVIGENHENFPEASALLEYGGLFAVKTTAECTQILNKLVLNKSFRNTAGSLSKEFIAQNRGATDIIMDYIQGEALIT